jgi:hypothetical protein
LEDWLGEAGAVLFAHTDDACAVLELLPDDQLRLHGDNAAFFGHRALACHRDVTQEPAAIREVHTLEALTETGSWSWSSAEGILEVSDECRGILGHVRQIMSDLFETSRQARGGLRPGDLARPPATTSGSRSE